MAREFTITATPEFRREKESALSTPAILEKRTLRNANDYQSALDDSTSPWVISIINLLSQFTYCSFYSGLGRATHRVVRLRFGGAFGKPPRG
jgi:hypothetical protein